MPEPKDDKSALKSGLPDQSVLDAIATLLLGNARPGGPGVLKTNAFGSDPQLPPFDQATQTLIDAALERAKKARGDFQPGVTSADNSAFTGGLPGPPSSLARSPSGVVPIPDPVKPQLPVKTQLQSLFGEPGPTAGDVANAGELDANARGFNSQQEAAKAQKQALLAQALKGGFNVQELAKFGQPRGQGPAVPQQQPSLGPDLSGAEAAFNRSAPTAPAAAGKNARLRAVLQGLTGGAQTDPNGRQPSLGQFLAQVGAGGQAAGSAFDADAKASQANFQSQQQEFAGRQADFKLQQALLQHQTAESNAQIKFDNNLRTYEAAVRAGEDKIPSFQALGNGLLAITTNGETKVLGFQDLSRYATQAKAIGGMGFKSPNQAKLAGLKLGVDSFGAAGPLVAASADLVDSAGAGNPTLQGVYNEAFNLVGEQEILSTQAFQELSTEAKDTTVKSLVLSQVLTILGSNDALALNVLDFYRRNLANQGGQQ